MSVSRSGPSIGIPPQRPLFLWGPLFPLPISEGARKVLWEKPWSVQDAPSELRYSVKAHSPVHAAVAGSLCRRIRSFQRQSRLLRPRENRASIARGRHLPR